MKQRCSQFLEIVPGTAGLWGMRPRQPAEGLKLSLPAFRKAGRVQDRREFADRIVHRTLITLRFLPLGDPSLGHDDRNLAQMAFVCEARNTQ
jgi:hypothetical protein